MYFGRFPVAHVGILVVAHDGSDISSGATYGFGSSAIRIGVGRGISNTVYEHDWVLVHEMIHLALPTVPRRSDWLLEGNATYVEPIARAQAGQLDPAEVWQWSVEGMPKGQEPKKPGGRRPTADPHFIAAACLISASRASIRSLSLSRVASDSAVSS